METCRLILTIPNGSKILKSIRLESFRPAIAVMIHFWSNLTIAKIKPGRCVQVFSGVVQRTEDFFGIFSNTSFPFDWLTDSFFYGLSNIIMDFFLIRHDYITSNIITVTTSYLK